jgi:hypothetical protein
MQLPTEIFNLKDEIKRAILYRKDELRAVIIFKKSTLILTERIFEKIFDLFKQFSNKL